LKANDQLFKPHLVSTKKSIITTIYDKENKPSKFTDIPLDGKIGYFIIAAPST